MNFARFVFARKTLVARLSFKFCLTNVDCMLFHGAESDFVNFNKLFFSDYESDYSHIYGRLPLPYGRFRQYPSPSHPSSRQMYVSEWEWTKRRVDSCIYTHLACDWPIARKVKHIRDLEGFRCASYSSNFIDPCYCSDVLRSFKTSCETSRNNLGINLSIEVVYLDHWFYILCLNGASTIWYI